MSGSCISLTVLDYDRFTKNDYCGMVVISCEEIPRLPDGFSGIDNDNAPQRKTYELPLVVNTATPALIELSRRSHQNPPLGDTKMLTLWLQCVVILCHIAIYNTCYFSDLSLFYMNYTII